MAGRDGDEDLADQDVLRDLPQLGRVEALFLLDLELRHHLRPDVRVWRRAQPARQRRHSGRVAARAAGRRGGGRRGRARTEQEEQQPVDPVHGGGEARDPPRDHAVLREPQRRPEPAEGLPRRVVHAVHQPERHGRRDGRRVRRGAQDHEDRERGELRAGAGGARVERAKGGAGAQRRGGARTISRLADGCANRPSSSQLELEYGVASGKAAPADMTAGARGRGAGCSGSCHSSSSSSSRCIVVASWQCLLFLLRPSRWSSGLFSVPACGVFPPLFRLVGAGATRGITLGQEPLCSDTFRA